MVRLKGISKLKDIAKLNKAFSKESLSRRLNGGWGLLLGALALGLAVLVAGCDATGSESTVPPAPSGLEATSGDGQVTLTWAAVEAANEYNVYRDTSPIGEVSGEPATSVLEPGVVDESVENGATYYYRVTAAADEEGEPSEEVEVTPFSDPPDRP